MSSGVAVEEGPDRVAFGEKKNKGMSHMSQEKKIQ